MWKEENNKLSRSFEFQNFREAFAFMTKVAFIAEEKQHHPEWTNSYNKLTIWLTTHDEGSKVTDKDRQMAKEIDRLIK